MCSVEKQANEFIKTRATATLCQLWKTFHDHLLERPQLQHEMVRIEDELERRFPEIFMEWQCASDTDYDRYCNPRNFFTIENADEVKIRPEICF